MRTRDAADGRRRSSAPVVIIRRMADGVSAASRGWLVSTMPGRMAHRTS